MMTAYDNTKTAVDNFVEAIRAERIEVAKYESSDASCYTLGYLSSTLVSVLMDMPAAARQRVLKDLAVTAAAKQQRIQEAA